MLKWSGRILVFLLIGAILNVAVAWCCVLTISWPARNAVHDPTSEQVHWWKQNAPHGFDPTPGGVSYPTKAFGSDAAHLSGTSSDEHGGRLHYGWRLRSGVPLRCFEGQRWIDYTNAPANEHRPVTIERGMKVWRRRGNNYDIPVTPIWGGMIGNSLLYAAIPFTLLFIPRWYLRRRRLRKRLCPACGYPMGASNRCTECGEPLPTETAK